MQTKELDSFKLSDAVTFHDELNPKLWVGNKLRPEVKMQLTEIAKDFLEEMGINDLDVTDITVSGSNAAYSYTKHSDLDLHILVNLKDLPNNEVYKELFQAKKTLYNDSHNITIHGVPVELYVQDASDPVVSLGEYSIKNDKWIKIPTKRRANFDQTASRSKYNKLLDVVKSILESKNLVKVNKILKKIKQYRQAGLDKGGEFGPENLAYKALRSQGYITKLYNLRDKLHSEVLSIEGMYANQNKIDKLAERLAKEFSQQLVTDEDYDPNGIPPGPEFKPTMPKGTVKVDVSDVYDWYKLGQHVSNLKGLGKHDFGKGPPSTILSFGDEDTEHKYINDLEKTGLSTTDIDPVDPNQPKGMKRQKVDPTYNVAEDIETNRISFKVQKGENKFATTLYVNSKPVGVYQYDATTGRSIAEVYPEFKGKGLGKLLVLHAIYTAAKLGLDFQEDESRTSEYDNVLDSLSGNGYIVDDSGYWYVTGEGEQYLKQSMKQGVAEAFNNPYKTKSEKSEYGDIDMLAKLPDGTNLSIMFNKQQDDDGEEITQVEFYRNNSQEVTGEGDAQRIFATVLASIQKYIKKYKPLRLSFSASKVTDPTIYYEPDQPRPNPESRAKLYDRLVQRYARAWGYRAFRADTGDLVIYELSRLKPAVVEDETLQYAAEKTPAINPYGGLKDRQYRGSISEMETDNQSSAKTGIYQSEVFGAKAYHSKCLEKGCDWESRRFDRIKQAQDAAKKHSQTHFKTDVAEASGYIPSEKEKNDPRFKTALTVDIHPYTMKKDAKKFGNKISRAGIPPTASPSGKF